MKVNQKYGVTEECERQPAKVAPYAYQTKTQPSTYKVGGKVDAKGSRINGGNMNGGGKRR